MDVAGLEYDWIASDATGHVALFSTAGAGYAPPAFLRDTDAHDAALRVVLGLPATTEAEFYPAVAAGLANTWRLVAERGLFAYDASPSGGPYRKVAAPVVATRLDALPPAVAAVARAIGCVGRFEAHEVVNEEMLESHCTNVP